MAGLFSVGVFRIKIELLLVKRRKKNIVKKNLTFCSFAVLLFLLLGFLVFSLKKMICICF